MSERRRILPPISEVFAVPHWPEYNALQLADDARTVNPDAHSCV